METNETFFKGASGCYGEFEYTIPSGYEAEIKDGKVIVKKKEEPLTEFENKLSAMVTKAVHKYCRENKLETPHFVGLTLGDDLAKEFSPGLLELAKKEFRIGNYDSFREGYMKGREDEYNRLPKWKKTKPKRGTAFGRGPWYPSGIDSGKGKHTVFLNGYEISVDELLEKLPKEEDQ